MGKVLALGGVALIVILLLLWRQLDSSPTATAATPPPPKVAAAPPTLQPWQVAERAAPAKLTDPAPVPAKRPDGKLDPRSDEFFFKHDEVVIPNLTRNAMKCYEGYTDGGKPALHRNSKIVIEFKQQIRNGTVTVRDVKVQKSTLKDSSLEACFLQQVRDTTWHRDDLPDWDQDDVLVISPERGGKKYTRANREATGPEEPREREYIKNDGHRYREDGSRID